MGRTQAQSELKEAARAPSGREPARSGLDRGGALPVQARLAVSLQSTAGNRALTGLLQRQGSDDEELQMKAAPTAPGQEQHLQRETGAFAAIQRVLTPEQETIRTLDALNTYLASHHATGIIPIVIAGNTADVNEAVAKSTEQVYEYVNATDLAASLQVTLAALMDPPEGYEQIVNGKFMAYKASNFVLSPAQNNLLVNAANDLGTAVHRSKKTQNMAKDADAYIHDYAANAVFSYRLDGKHRSIPKVIVLQHGAVNDGWHNFV